MGLELILVGIVHSYILQLIFWWGNLGIELMVWWHKQFFADLEFVLAIGMVDIFRMIGCSLRVECHILHHKLVGSIILGYIRWIDRIG